MVTVLACGSDYPSSARQQPVEKTAWTAKPVEVVPAKTLTLENTVRALGSLAAYDQATLSVKVSGEIAALPVDLGSVVEREQMIAQVEQRDFQLRLAQAKAELAQARAQLGLPLDGTNDEIDPEQTGTVRQARATLDEALRRQDRLQTLVIKGFVAQAEFDAAEAAATVARSRYQEARELIRTRQGLLRQRRAEVALAQQQLADTVLSAPFAGVVQERHASIGEYLAAGTPVVTLVRIDPLRLRVEVPERDARNVHLGQTVRLAVNGGGTVKTGQIMRLSPTLDEQNRMLLVEADIENAGGLRPGMFVQAEIVTAESSTAVGVPTAAVVSFAGLKKVFIVRDDKAVEREITIGRRAGEWTEVLNGVEPGDLVIIEPGTLQSGQAVLTEQS